MDQARLAVNSFKRASKLAGTEGDCVQTVYDLQRKSVKEDIDRWDNGKKYPRSKTCDVLGSLHDFEFGSRIASSFRSNHSLMSVKHSKIIKAVATGGVINSQID